MNKIIIILILFFFSCKGVNNDNYLKKRKMFLEVYSSLNYNEFNKSSFGIEEAKGLLNVISNLSTSKEHFYFEIMSYRLSLLSLEDKKALDDIKCLEEINPMMYFFYRGALFELLKNNDNNKNYKKSLTYCKDDFFKIFLQFLIDNNLNFFYQNLKKYNNQAYNYYKKKNDNNPDSFRKEIIVNEVFNQFYLPEN